MARPPIDRTAFIAALPGEVRALARLPALGSVRRGDGSRVILGGVGAVRARAAAERAVAEGALGLVSWGVAAALESRFAPGDLLLADAVLGANGVRYAVDTDWRDHIVARLPAHRSAPPVTLVEADQVIDTVSGKTRLREMSGAAGCDMESAAVAAVAAEHGLSFVAVRAVLDDATMILPPAALAAMDESGHLKLVALTRAMLGRPLAVHGQLRGLKHLAVAFRAARLALADTVPAMARDAAA